MLTELLQKKHNRINFDCGKELLNNYLKNQARQDQIRNLASCFVLLNDDNILIKGYYTLSNTSIPLETLPNNLKDKLPLSYKNIPTTLMGRFAINQQYQGQGIGKILLIDALKRCYNQSNIIGSFGIVVDPIDKDAECFYSHYNFIKLPDSGKMFISMKTLDILFKES